jgi:hypothetical protein
VLWAPLHADGVSQVGESLNLLLPDGLIAQKSGQEN